MVGLGWYNLPQTTRSEANNESEALHAVNAKRLVIVKHGNVRFQTAKMIKEAIQTLDWDVLGHHPYFLDLALFNFYIFRSISNALCCVSFKNDGELSLRWARPSSRDINIHGKLVRYYIFLQKYSFMELKKQPRLIGQLYIIG